MHKNTHTPFGVWVFLAEMELFDLHRHPGMDADYGVAAVQPAASNAPPEHCIYIVQIPHRR